MSEMELLSRNGKWKLFLKQKLKILRDLMRQTLGIAYKRDSEREFKDEAF